MDLGVMVAVALVSFVLGLMASWAVLRHVRTTLRRDGADAEPSLDDWQSADPFRAWWGILAAIAGAVAVSGGIYGLGASAPLRAGLLGFPAGFCLLPLVHGWSMRRRERRTSPP